MVNRSAVGRSEALREQVSDCTFVGVGTSGGVWGAERGYCMMISGGNDVVHHLDPIFSAILPGRHTSVMSRRLSRIVMLGIASPSCEAPKQDFVQLFRRGQIVTEWFFVSQPSIL